VNDDPIEKPASEGESAGGLLNFGTRISNCAFKKPSELISNYEQPFNLLSFLCAFA
jgi:hypothetical protein